MKFFLLDVVAGSEYVAAGFGVVVFMIGCVLTEAAIIYWLKTVPTFKKAFIISLAVNLVTMLIGFALVQKIEDILDNESQGPLRIAVYFVTSVIVEGLLLKPFLKTTGWGKIAITAFLMNVVTYGLLVALIEVDF